jgi:uncharacterized protein
MDSMLAALLTALAVTFPTGEAVLRTPAKVVTVKVEFASTTQQLERGLTGRMSLPRNAGMAFLFAQARRGSFWMKGVKFPLSIAFWGRHGRILRILDMRPCGRAPCVRYNPRVDFWGALEVNRGAFRRWGVRAGDFVEIRR